MLNLLNIVVWNIDFFQRFFSFHNCPFLDRDVQYSWRNKKEAIKY